MCCKILSINLIPATRCQQHLPSYDNQIYLYKLSNVLQAERLIALLNKWVPLPTGIYTKLEVCRVWVTCPRPKGMRVRSGFSPLFSPWGMLFALSHTLSVLVAQASPALTLAVQHICRSVLITQQRKTLYVVCYFISRNMVRSLHYIKQLCVYLGSKCYLVVSLMVYFVSSITFPFSLSILQQGPKQRNGASHSLGQSDRQVLNDNYSPS